MKNNLAIVQALKLGRQKLIAQSTSADLDVEVLLMFVLKKEKSFLFTYPEKKLTGLQTKKFTALIKKRAQNWPVAYLTEEKNFYNLKLKVNKHVLIPRPDSELLVEKVIKQIKLKSKKTNLLLIDLGTGSGCLPIAVNKNILPLKIPTLATDISAAALKLAKKNARRYKLKIKFLRGNLLNPLQKIIAKNSSAFFLIMANLPYLTTKQLTEKTIQKEPRRALYGGSDGLFFYQKMLEQIKKNQIKNGMLFLEIDPAQKNKITSLIKKILPQAKVESKKDLANLIRLVIVTL